MLSQFRSSLPEVLFVCLSAVAFHGGAAAQSAATRPPKTPIARQSSPRAASRSPNVKAGEITLMDTANDSITIRDRSASPVAYVLTEKTRFNRNRRPAQPADFKAGDSVVLRFRRSRSDGSLVVTELDDANSWTWLSEVRKTTTQAVIKAIADTVLSVGIGSNDVPMDYTISDKTLWEKDGKAVDAAAFKAGDHVFIVPRSLPSGSIMARAVADTTAGAAQEKERLAASARGTIVSIELPAHRFLLKTVANDTRSFAFDDQTEVVQNGRPLTPAGLKPGQHIVARLRHEIGGDELVWRITIEKVRKAPAPKKRLPIKGAATGQ